MSTDQASTIIAGDDPRSRKRVGDGQLRLVCYRHVYRRIEFRNAWNSLCRDQIFLSWEWLACWYEQFAVPGSARILVIVDDRDQWVAILPLYIRQTRWRGRVLAMMGDGRPCSDYMSPVARPPYREQSIRMFADWIQSAAKREAIDLIEFDGTDRHDETVALLSRELQVRQMAIDSDPIASCWQAALPSDWGTFESSLSKSFRRKIKKAFANRALPNVTVESIESPEKIELIWPEVERLHTSRRQCVGDAGCFEDAGFSKFLKQAFLTLAISGRARLLVARLNDRPFGVLFLLTPPTGFYVYQSGFDPAASRLEPGHLLATCAVEQAIAEGKSVFDFLRGDEPYKARWSTQPIGMQRVTAVPRRWPAFARNHLFRLLQKAKRYSSRFVDRLAARSMPADESPS